MSIARLRGAASDLDDDQVGNPLKVTQIPGSDRVTEVESGCADQQVRKRNRMVELPRLGVDPRRSVAISTPVSRTNPMPADSMAHGVHQWQIAHPWRSRDRERAYGRASLHMP